MKEDLAIAKNSLLVLYEENQQLKKELGREDSKVKTDGVRITNISEEADSKPSTGEVAELKQRLDEERKLRQEADKELELQVAKCKVIIRMLLMINLQMDLKAEMEVAMKLLEKDIHEKQDTIISLRRQLDDIKLINLEMYKKLQVS